MTLPFAARASILRPSPTLAIASKARQLRAEGKDVISFGAGEPDFESPTEVVEAAIQALKEGKTKYTPTAGTAELKEAVVDKLRRENAVPASPSQIVVSCGAKQSLFNAFQTLVDPGDEVVVFAPYWMTYLDQITLAGGVPKIVRTDPSAGFQPDIDDVKRAIGPRTKAIVINSPCNPTGAVFPRATVEAIAGLAERHGCWIVSDEIYEKLVYGTDPVSPASLGPEIAERTVTVNGCSKSYSMTGWRIGYACAPEPLATKMSSLQDQTTSNATSFAQSGAVAALRLPAERVESMRAAFERRRDMMVAALAEVPGVRLACPDGAFYVLPDFSEILGGSVPDDAGLASLLLDKALVATVPGSVFGQPGSIRLSYACSESDILEGTARIKETVCQIVT